MKNSIGLLILSTLWSIVSALNRMNKDYDLAMMSASTAMAVIVLAVIVGFFEWSKSNEEI